MMPPLEHLALCLLRLLLKLLALSPVRLLLKREFLVHWVHGPRGALAHPPAAHEANHSRDWKERNQGDVHGGGRLLLVVHLSGVEAGVCHLAILRDSNAGRGNRTYRRDELEDVS